MLRFILKLMLIYRINMRFKNYLKITQIQSIAVENQINTSN